MYERREPEGDGTGPPSERSGVSPALIVLGIVAIVAVIFIVQNNEQRQIEFLFFDVSTPVWVALLVAIGTRRRARSAVHLLVESAAQARRLLIRKPTRCCASRRPTASPSRCTSWPAQPVRIIRSCSSPTPPASTLTPTSPWPPRWPRASTPSAFDFRGHGDTPLAPGWTVEWGAYGDDALGAAEAVAATPRAARGLIGFGHSMGGTALLLAAHRRPELFSLLVLFEPIVPPIDEVTEASETDRVNTLVTATRRRRALFPSVDAARANYAAKPPLDAWDPAALDAYVQHGFHADVDGAGVRLKCDPELEARTFEAGTTQDTWQLLPEIAVPVVVVSGRVADDQPSRFAADVAEALPHGRFVERPELDHFGPMTHPRLIGELIAGWADDQRL